MLAKDPLIGPFMHVPCKENGFDIEGLAARGDRLWLGMRGPVIGKQAMIVELRMKVTSSGWLKPRRLCGKQRYRLLALPLDGLGVRDLLLVGDHLLVLAGATTALEGPQNVYAIDIPQEDGPNVIHSDQVRPLLELPVRRGVDHAEGLALMSLRGKRQLAVAFDSPSPERIDLASDCLRIDVYDLPQL